MAERRITMKSIASTPTWSAKPGQVVSVPEAEAKQLVEGGFAEYAAAAPAVPSGGESGGHKPDGSKKDSSKKDSSKKDS